MTHIVGGVALILLGLYALQRAKEIPDRLRSNRAGTIGGACIAIGALNLIVGLLWSIQQLPPP